MSQVLSQSTLQEIVKLKQKKFRDQKKEYLLSGFRAVQGALESKNLRAKALIYNKDIKNEFLKIRLPADLPVYSISKKEFDHLSDEKNPQGVALLLERPELSLDQIQVNNPISLYLEEVSDPGNLGTIIRTALWFGVEDIMLSPRSADPFQPKVVRASAGYITHAHIYENVTVNDLIKLKQNQTLTFAGTVLDSNNTLKSVKPMLQNSFVITFGSEARGLSTELFNICDYHFTIPKKGKGESLNLAVAVALSIAELS